MFYIMFYSLSLYAVCHCHEWAPLELGWHPGPDAAPVGAAALPCDGPGTGAVADQVLVHVDDVVWAPEVQQCVFAWTLGMVAPVPTKWGAVATGLRCPIQFWCTGEVWGSMWLHGLRALNWVINWDWGGAFASLEHASTLIWNMLQHWSISDHLSLHKH